mmetsp:Transcript_12467/g.35012  ORF Transcript_12467/g.35012 Transcript_12467/m.35012 type:complete len:317 (-) Transcript_12467:81-1031(-)
MFPGRPPRRGSSRSLSTDDVGWDPEPEVDAAKPSPQLVLCGGTVGVPKPAPSPLHGRRASRERGAGPKGPAVAGKDGQVDSHPGSIPGVPAPVRRTSSATGRWPASKPAGDGPSGAKAALSGLRSMSMGGRPGVASGTQPSMRRLTGQKSSRVSTGRTRSDDPSSGPKVLGKAWKIPHPKGGNIDVLEYAPQVGKPVGIVVATPGSSGGFGPSIDHPHRGLPLSRQGSLASRGSLYARLGLELSTGLRFDWGNRQVGQGAGGGAVDGSAEHIVVIQMTWRHAEDGVKWPGSKLKHLDSLAASSGDICVVVDWATKR